jgi:hypothetical protein
MNDAQHGFILGAVVLFAPLIPACAVTGQEPRNALQAD